MGNVAVPSSPRAPGGSSVRPARTLLALLVALLGAACGGPIVAPVAGDPLADAPWEAGWAADELTETIASTVWETDLSTRPPSFRRCPGVRVELLLPRPDGAGPLVPAGETTTDADGAFRLGGVPRGPWVVRTSKEGFAAFLAGRDHRVRGPMPADFTSERTFGLQSARRLTVRVVDRETRPVAGVEAEVQGFAFFARATTGATGAFVLDVPAERVLLSVWHPDWELTPRFVTPEETSVELVMVRTRPFSGFVVSRDGERPIQGATVVWLEDPSRRAQTDREGRFTLPVPRRGRFAAFADGFAWESYEVSRAAELEMRLRRSPRVRGRVIDAFGAPVAGARVQALGTDPDGPCTRAPGPLTGEDGSFEMSWVPASAAGGRSYVYAWHRRQGMSALAALPEDRSDPETPVELVLSGLEDVRGQVVDARGAPVARATVEAAWSLGPAVGEREAGFTDLPVTRADATGADGGFTLRDVPADRPVTVTVAIYGLERFVELPAGAARDAVRVEIPAGLKLAGRVVASDGGEPGAPGTVVARLVDVPGTAYERRTETGPDGAFVFEEVPKGRYLLEATVEGFDIAGAGDVRAGDEDARLTVRRAARLGVRIATGDGSPLPDEPCTVVVEDADDPHLPVPRLEFTREQASRTIELGRYRPGRWRVRVASGVWRGESEVLELTEGQVREAEVTLARTLRLRVRVEASDGRPLPGELVHAFPVPERDENGRIRTDSGPAPPPIGAETRDDGTLDVAGIRPGRWVLKTSPRDRATVALEVEFPHDDVIRLRLPPSGDVVVRVRDADGAAVPQAIVSLRDLAGEPVSAWSPGFAQRTSRTRTDDDGVARFRGVPVGPVVVTGTANGASLGPLRAEVGDGTILELMLE